MLKFDEWRTLPKGKKEEYLYKAIEALADHLEVEFEEDLITEPEAPNAVEGYAEEGV